MTYLGTSTIDAPASDTKELAETCQETEMGLRARDDIEQVVIETVHVGDDVFLEPGARPASARCVIRKRAKANERTARVVGWLLDLT